MKGHERLIDMRRAGKAPRFVFINDYPCKTDWFENPGDAVTVCTHGDSVELIDLRFLVGLKVSISGEDEARVKKLYERCKASGVGMVAACHIQPGVKRWDQAGWAEVWKRPEVAHG
jgi:hypothetical protein